MIIIKLILGLIILSYIAYRLKQSNNKKFIFLSNLITAFIIIILILITFNYIKLIYNTIYGVHKYLQHRLKDSL